MASGDNQQTPSSSRETFLEKLVDRQRSAYSEWLDVSRRPYSKAEGSEEHSREMSMGNEVLAAKSGT